jgi:3-oxoacyl-[acyl-carrier protein] reductase
MKLNNKVAIVTGSASGIGLAIAELFAQEKAAVIVADLPSSNGEMVAEKICKSGGQALFVPVDVRNEANVRQLADKTVKEFGKVDILVANAGVGLTGTNVEEIDAATFEKVMAVNVGGVFFSAKAVIPYMKKARSGVILATGSTGGLRPRPGLSVYNASKGAVRSFIKSLAVELAPYQIRANCVHPSATNTPMLTETQRREFIKNIPLGMAEPLDIAHAALFLASDDARMITGIDVTVDGGRCV